MSARPRALLAACLAAAGAAGLCVLFIVLTVVAAIGGFASGAAGCESAGALALPSSGAALVAATVYSGAGPGAYGAGLAGHLAYAELGLWSETDGDRAHADRIGTALGLGGALAPFTLLMIRAPNGRSVVAEKRDIGMGGAPIDGHPRAIDLWTATREALALPPDWSGLVRVEAVSGTALSTEAATTGAEAGQAGVGRTGGAGAGDPEGAGAGECGADSLPAESLGPRIVAIARGQLGTTERPAGSECTPYGPCEPWCALFATWVWRRAGVHIPALAFSGDIYEWARRHLSAHPPGALPRPGWVALFGSGPADAATSLHAAIVQSVLPGGRVTFVNGNFAGRVMLTGPCLPSNATGAGSGGCEEPGPIYGYAAPR